MSITPNRSPSTEPFQHPPTLQRSNSTLSNPIRDPELRAPTAVHATPPIVQRGVYPSYPHPQVSHSKPVSLHTGTRAPSPKPEGDSHPFYSRTGQSAPPSIPISSLPVSSSFARPVRLPEDGYDVHALKEKLSHLQAVEQEKSRQAYDLERQLAEQKEINSALRERLEKSRASPTNEESPGSVHALTGINNELRSRIAALESQLKHKASESSMSQHGLNTMFERERAQLVARCDRAEQDCARKDEQFQREMSRVKRELELVHKEELLKVLDNSSAKLVSVEQQEASRWTSELERLKRNILDKDTRISELEAELTSERTAHRFTESEAMRKLNEHRAALEAQVTDLQSQLRSEKSAGSRALHESELAHNKTRAEYENRLLAAEDALLSERQERAKMEAEYQERLKRMAGQRDLAVQERCDIDKQLHKLTSDRTHRLSANEHTITQLQDTLIAERKRRETCESEIHSRESEIDRLRRDRDRWQTECKEYERKYLETLEAGPVKRAEHKPRQSEHVSEAFRRAEVLLEYMNQTKNELNRSGTRSVSPPFGYMDTHARSSSRSSVSPSKFDPLGEKESNPVYSAFPSWKPYAGSVESPNSIREKDSGEIKETGTGSFGGNGQ